MFSGAQAELSAGNFIQKDGFKILILFYQGPQANSQAELSASAQTELPTEASPGSRHQMLSGQSFNYRLVIHPYNNSFEDNYDHYSLEFQPECFSD